MATDYWYVARPPAALLFIWPHQGAQSTTGISSSDDSILLNPSRSPANNVVLSSPVYAVSQPPQSFLSLSPRLATVDVQLASTTSTSVPPRNIMLPVAMKR